ncbi:MAG: ACT domain-containing protein [Mycobacteriales bacterium]
MSYLLRVVLPDRPGMLGALATALGEVGADIISLDVVERGPDGAVDDLLVELPLGGLADRLITAAQSVPDLIVESLRPYVGAADLHGDLELVEALASTTTPREVLLQHAPGVFRAGWALLVEDSAPTLRTSGAPELTAFASAWPTVTTARRVDSDEEWVPKAWRLLGTELVVAPMGTAAVLLGRPGGPIFRRSEVLRLGHLAGITANAAAAAVSG